MRYKKRNAFHGTSLANKALDSNAFVVCFTLWHLDYTQQIRWKWKFLPSLVHEFITLCKGFLTPSLYSKVFENINFVKSPGSEYHVWCDCVPVLFLTTKLGLETFASGICIETTIFQSEATTWPIYYNLNYELWRKFLFQGNFICIDFLRKGLYSNLEAHQSVILHLPIMKKIKSNYSIN